MSRIPTLSVRGGLIPSARGPATTAAYNALFPHQGILLHTPLSGDSKVIIICPQALSALVHAMHSIIRHHDVGTGGGVFPVHIDATTLPTADVINAAGSIPRGVQVDAVVVFGYKDIQSDLSESRLMH